jgi:hypothetical protein
VGTDYQPDAGEPVEDMKKSAPPNGRSSTVDIRMPTTAAQIVIESKEDARKRGVKSADRAEAVNARLCQGHEPS